jgi:hypothetical protein
MTVHTDQSHEGKVLTVRVTGKLHKDDYDHFVPEIEAMIRLHGKVRVLVDMHDFHGWNASALWQDIKFDVKHFNDIERLAIVGESKWEKGMAVFCKPFTTAKVRYFDRAAAGEAHVWIGEGIEAHV